jgi:hypothetical protein
MAPRTQGFAARRRSPWAGFSRSFGAKPNAETRPSPLHVFALKQGEVSTKDDANEFTGRCRRIGRLDYFCRLRRRYERHRQEHGGEDQRSQACQIVLPHRRHSQGTDARLLEVDPRRRAQSPTGTRQRRDPLEQRSQRTRFRQADRSRRELHHARCRRDRAGADRQDRACRTSDGRQT